MRDLVWWRSDEAKDARAKLYLAELLFRNPDNRREEYKTGHIPEWPAVFHYCTTDDTPYWVEVKVAIHARDYARDDLGGHMNEAAKKLAAG